MRKLAKAWPLVLLGLNFAGIASAQICQNSGQLCNPTQVSSIDVFISNNVFPSVFLVIGILAIAAVVYSGIRMIVSQGNEEDVAKAKTNFQWSLTGLVVVLMAFIIVNAVGLFLGYNSSISPNPSTPVSPIASQDFISLSNVIFQGILSIAALLALLMIIVSGFRYLTARGDEEQVKSAKASLQWALIGLAITALAYVIVTAIVKLL